MNVTHTRLIYHLRSLKANAQVCLAQICIIIIASSRLATTLLPLHHLERHSSLAVRSTIPLKKAVENNNIHTHIKSRAEKEHEWPAPYSWSPTGRWRNFTATTVHRGSFIASSSRSPSFGSPVPATQLSFARMLSFCLVCFGVSF